MPRASQHGLLTPPALKNFFDSDLDFKGFHKVNGMTARSGTVCGKSGIIGFGEKDPEATLHELKFSNNRIALFMSGFTK